MTAPVAYNLSILKSSGTAIKKEYPKSCMHFQYIKTAYDVLSYNKQLQLRRPQLQTSLLKKHWTALHAARQLAASQPKSLSMVALYNEARTYFMKQT
jgi:hypothetical protein